MHRHPPERTEAEKTNATDEKLLAAQNETEVLREQVESWCEQTQSLTMNLLEVEQELQYTNRELCAALRLESVSLAEAKQLAQTILTQKKSAREIAASLLSAIYGSTVNPEEWQQIDRTRIKKTPEKSADVNRILAKSKELKAQSKQLRAQLKELGYRLVGTQANYTKLQELYAKFSDKSIEKNDGSTNHSASNSLSHSPPPSLT